MQRITRDELYEKLDKNIGLPLVDVLSARAFDEFHLPGATNIPLDDSFDEAIAHAYPNKDQEIVVYCASRDCPASEKAARRMEALGYSQVLDYEGGKADWRAAGLPVEH